MQFGRVISDSSDSESTVTGGSHSYGMSSDTASNEEEDDDDSEDIKVLHRVPGQIRYDHLSVLPSFLIENHSELHPLL